MSLLKLKNIFGHVYMAVWSEASPTEWMGASSSPELCFSSCVLLICWQQGGNKQEVTKRRPTEQGGLGEGLQPLRLVTHAWSTESLLKPHKTPGQSLSVPTHLGLSSAVKQADNRWEWSSHMPSVCAEKAAHCFSIAQPWRSSSQRHGAHHQPSRLAPPKGNQDVHFLLKCLIVF